MGRITLLTDFGTRDGYVGAMKGVLVSLAPGVILDDITHDIPRGDVRKAARVLGRFWRQFPRGTVHLAVVDPGVGTGRKAAAAEAAGRFFVAPDNGVLTSILISVEDVRAVEIQTTEPPERSGNRTFHGRDVFAPAAGLLARGATLEELGPPLADPVRLDLAPEPLPSGSRVGQVQEVDRFGNLATDLPPDDVEMAGEVEVTGVRIPFMGTYGDVATGEFVAVTNSDGLVEVAVRDGSAAERLGLGVGGRVRIPGVRPPGLREPSE